MDPDNMTPEQLRAALAERDAVLRAAIADKEEAVQKAIADKEEAVQKALADKDEAVQKALADKDEAVQKAKNEAVTQVWYEVFMQQRQLIKTCVMPCRYTEFIFRPPDWQGGM
jgi:regulator of protease activity HflC (stomatin/prohibitin superfamily)